MGFTIHPRRGGIDPVWIERFKVLPVSTISDSMERLHGVGMPLRAMHGGGRMVGTAFTVKTRPGDNLIVHKALDLAAPGEVVVVDAGGEQENAIIGELMAAYAEQRGLAGIVIFGAIRDSAELARGTFPVFATGVTHRGPYKDGPGVINIPIAVAGLPVSPGDLVCGDSDGLLAITPAALEDVHDRAAQKLAAEQQMMLAIRAGTDDRSWIDRALEAAGCDYRDA
ncbi:RraA family protein [Aurantimonas endophytica]|uniref:Putative 4-hydroxy-4-methyl-2-oxoglutarate aldolase n=1 Tax=Aurantimonas endophytica TaxID=1522175 RepID=A0A7W6MQ39_9HYPH|nr:RraA family protein [Aurantimonas endophytica]MBB4003573.1 RraA family protein [Aurantimonas endophytica]MCO6404431.1 RraA family protein [Aurantimonas endophytica]